jgi:hypothetical protein
MMAAQDDVMLLMAKDASLKFAGYRHGSFLDLFPCLPNQGNRLHVTRAFAIGLSW